MTTRTISKLLFILLYAEEVHELRKKLINYVPVGKTFNEAWNLANAAFYQDKHSKKSKQLKD